MLLLDAASAPSIWTELFPELLKLGILGPVLVAAGWYINKQNVTIAAIHGQLQAVQDKRTSDAQAVTDKVVGLTEKWHGVISDQVHLVEETQKTLVEIREALDRLLERKTGR